jgi:hypothetical protein
MAGEIFYARGEIDVVHRACVSECRADVRRAERSGLAVNRGD